MEEEFKGKQNLECQDEQTQNEFDCFVSHLIEVLCVVDLLHSGLWVICLVYFKLHLRITLQ
jgi:hypothetical protein